MEITFEYRVSSENGWDYFTILLNGTQVVNIAGETSYQSYTVTLNAGESLTLQYSKDGSVSSGDDCAYIKNLVITTNQMVEASS